MSGANVFRVTAVAAPPRYLKVAKGAAATALRQEIERTTWLAAHGMRVPETLRSHKDGRRMAWLMSAVPGTCAEDSDLPPEKVVEAIGHALRALHALPAETCPFDETIAMRLARAERAIARNEIDPEHFAPRNQDIAPGSLLDRLRAEAPAEDLVVAHGDATLSNIMVADDFSVGLVDCGHAGRADRYLDLALTAEGIAGHFGAELVDLFARAYGLASLDRGKAAFFSDLYELF